MKKLTIIFCLMFSIVIAVKAINIINISSFPNITSPLGNYQIVFADPGVTNYQMSVTQLITWLSSDPSFIAALKGQNLGGSTTNFTLFTNSPNYFNTNLIAFWATNASFTSIAPFNPSPVAHSELIISNTANAKITNTLPWTAYSVSLGAPVTQAVVATNSVLHLKVNYFNGMYYIEDYGKNNPTLWSLATNLNDAGFVVITNGQISIRH